MHTWRILRLWAWCWTVQGLLTGIVYALAFGNTAAERLTLMQDKNVDRLLELERLRKENS